MGKKNIGGAVLDDLKALPKKILKPYYKNGKLNANKIAIDGIPFVIIFYVINKYVQAVVSVDGGDMLDKCVKAFSLIFQVKPYFAPSFKLTPLICGIGAGVAFKLFMNSRKKNVMNEMYAKDISKKIKSTFKSKGKSGKHVASVTPYGYLKDENDGNHWIVDEEAAEIVRLIFKWTIDGLGPYQIAKLLQEKKVEIPAVHMARFGQGNNRNKKVKDPYGWGSSTVVGILKKREYLGHTVNFKTQKHFKDKKSHYVSEDNWVIFENTQEPIIDQQTFDTVQKLRENVRRYPDGWGEHHVLTGLMYCADCGAKMYVHRTSNGKRIAQYTCSAYTKVPCGTLCKTQHRINESVVLELIGDTLRARKTTKTR